MATDSSLLRTQLSILTGDLQPTQSGTDEDLAAAREAVLQALVGGQTLPIASPEVVAKLTQAARIPAAIPESARQASNLAITNLTLALEPPLVYRRDLPVRSPLIPSSVPSWAIGQQPQRSYGPFVDAVGRQIHIDIFPIIRQWRFVRTAGGAPFLILPIVGSIVASRPLPIAAGSLWFSGSAIEPTTPAGGYCGIVISGGTFEIIGAAPHIAGDEVIVAPGSIVRVSANVHAPVAPVGTGPGLDARLARPTYFPTLALQFGAANATCEPTGQASLDVYGESVQLAPTAINPRYVPSLRMLAIPLACQSPSFAVQSVQSDLFIPSGSAPILESTWSIPVTVVPATSLGAANGAGFLSLELGPGLSARWKGTPSAIPLASATLLVAPGLLGVQGQLSAAQSRRERIDLWDAPSQCPSWLELNWPGSPLLTFIAAGSGTTGGSGNELLNGDAALTCTLDRPLTLDGARTPVSATRVPVFISRASEGFRLFFEGALAPPSKPRRLGYALENAVLLTNGAVAIGFAASYDGTSCPQGRLALEFGLHQFLPSLPDPYAANFNLPDRLTDAVSAMLALVSWQASAKPDLEYRFAPLPAAVLPQSATPQTGNSAPPTELTLGVDTHLLPAAGLALLDVSSNADQFGVLLGPNEKERAAGGLSVSSEGEIVRVPATQLRVFTQPAVQWEPVVTLQDTADPSYPKIISYSDNFGPSQLWNQTATLIRAAPALALDAFVAAAASADANSPVFARFTLPFGMVAAARMTGRSDSASTGTEVAYVRPKFTAPAGQGGRQVMLKALHPQGQASASASPGLAGSAVQLSNASGSGSNAAWSVLDTDVTTTFNANFATGGTHTQIPVTRIDLSGYGESAFSDWRNPEDAAAVVSQVRLDVLVGRAAMEVVQIRSVLYPYAVRVVRTIVIQRANEGAVVRRDSGWQAVTEGAYAYPDYTVTPGLNPSAPIKTHPGVLTAAQDVVNILDTGLKFTTTKYGTILAAVRFDCALQIEGVVRSGSAAGVPARGQLGFVQLTDPNNIGKLDPEEYAELLGKYGPLGGTVDSTIDIGGSGQLMRVARVGFGAAEGPGGPEFPATVWGSPLFPHGAGQFSMARHRGPSDPPVAVDPALGVPLTRAGAVPSGPDPQAPYRFADPSDLLQPDSPVTEYGVVHDGGLQRTFFPRPIIAPGSSAITSTQPGAIADPYLLPTTFGLFPTPIQCIPFPNANWRLVIGAGGDLALDLGAMLPFSVTIPQRTLADGNAVKCIADYSQATVALAIDSSKTPGWSFALADIGLATSASGLGEVVRITGTVVGAAGMAPVNKNFNVTYGGAFSMVRDLLAFLQHLGDLLPPLNVAMTNSWTETRKSKLKEGMEIPLGKMLNQYTMPAAIILTSTNIKFVDTIWADPSSSENQLSLSFDAGALIPIVGFLDGVGLLKLKLQLNTSEGVIFSLTAMAGVGTGEVFGPFKAIAYIAAGIIGIAGSQVLGVGGTLLIKASVDLVVASASISLDGKLVWLRQTCTAGVTTWAYARLTIAIDITLVFVLDIKFEEAWEWDDNANGGPCTPIPSTP